MNQLGSIPLKRSWLITKKMYLLQNSYVRSGNALIKTLLLLPTSQFRTDQMPSHFFISGLSQKKMMFYRLFGGHIVGESSMPGSKFSVGQWIKPGIFHSLSQKTLTICLWSTELSGTGAEHSV